MEYRLLVLIELILLGTARSQRKEIGEAQINYTEKKREFMKSL